MSVVLCCAYIIMYMYSCADLHENGITVVLSDNGSEFCNKLNCELAEILGVKRQLITPYHPQVDV